MSCYIEYGGHDALSAGWYDKGFLDLIAEAMPNSPHPLMLNLLAEMSAGELHDMLHSPSWFFSRMPDTEND